MTPKDKAKELVDKYYNRIPMPSDCETGCMQCDIVCENNFEVAKQYALIAVDEILEIVPSVYFINHTWETPKIFWQEVKQEIELL